MPARPALCYMPGEGWRRHTCDPIIAARWAGTISRAKRAKCQGTTAEAEGGTAVCRSQGGVMVVAGWPLQCRHQCGGSEENGPF